MRRAMQQAADHSGPIVRIQIAEPGQGIHEISDVIVKRRSRQLSVMQRVLNDYRGINARQHGPQQKLTVPGRCDDR